MSGKSLSYVFLPTPKDCDQCAGPLQSVMYDARTRRGLWGCFCESCFQAQCMGLGVGKGQKYKRRDDGLFEKVSK